MFSLTDNSFLLILSFYLFFSHPESLNLIEESLDVTHETKQVPLPQPCLPAIGLAIQEVTCQETVPITAEVKSQELIPQTTEEIQKIPSGESETEGENSVTLKINALHLARYLIIQD